MSLLSMPRLFKNVYPVSLMNRSSPNYTTIGAYNRKVDAYISTTPKTYQPHHASMLKWIDNALQQIPPAGFILEIGSGTLRDASYMRSKGYSVQCSDASIGFVEYLRNQGDNAILLDLLNDPILDPFDLVFANAVAPHFTDSDVIKAIKNTYSALPQGGVLAFNLKRGYGDAWVTEKIGEKRYMNYWQPDEIELLIKEQGFHITFMDDHAAGDLPTHTWINIVAKKM